MYNYAMNLVFLDPSRSYPFWGSTEPWWRFRDPMKQHHAKCRFIQPEPCLDHAIIQPPLLCKLFHYPSSPHECGHHIWSKPSNVKLGPFPPRFSSSSAAFVTRLLLGGPLIHSHDLWWKVVSPHNLTLVKRNLKTWVGDSCESRVSQLICTLFVEPCTQVYTSSSSNVNRSTSASAKVRACKNAGSAHCNGAVKMSPEYIITAVIWSQAIFPENWDKFWRQR